MKLIFYILIFALITSFVDTIDDACARISNEYRISNKNPNFSAKYSDVKACFESFPYNKELAEKSNLINTCVCIFLYIYIRTVY